MAKRKTTKAGATASKQAAGKTAAPTRKRTGATKREQRKKAGLPIATDGVLTATTVAEAERKLFELGRSQYASGKRVTSLVAYNAFDPIAACIAKRPSAFAERCVTALLVQGAARLVQRLKPFALVELPEAPAPAKSGKAAATPDVATPPATASELLAAAVKFVKLRRGSVKRVASSPEEKTFRHGFGLGTRMKEDDPAIVLKASRDLFTGVLGHQGTQAAALFTQSDLEKLKTYIEKLAGLDQVETQANHDDASTSVDELILRAGLLHFYKLFGAAANLVFEDDEKARVEALQLIPRREESRSSQQSGDSQQSGGGTAPPAGTGQPSSGGNAPPAGTAQPSSGGTAPPAGTAQPSSGGTAPPAGTAQPSSGGNAPPAGTTP